MAGHEAIQPQESSPLKKKLIRGYGFAAMIIAMGAVVAVGIKSSNIHRNIYLLANIIISIIITSFLAFWYKRGTLKSDVWWFMIIAFSSLIYQSIASIIYVFRRDITNDGFGDNTTISSSLRPLTMFNTFTRDPDSNQT